MLTLSLIIPVYNEERHMKACLDAIARQTIAPDEVIVVDNNCTDGTVAIAQSYDFVQVVREPRQGLIYARNTGFELATSDIYGRIDADSVIDHDWVARVKAQLNSNKKLAGVTGCGRTDILPYLPWPKSVIFSRIYYWYIQVSIGVQVLWGANMAISEGAWKAIKHEVHLNDKVVHEDQDISILLLSRDLMLRLDKTLRITTHGHQYVYLPKLEYYRKLHISTKRLHQAQKTLQKAQKYRVPRATLLFLAIATLPAALYLWTVAIVFFPVDYSLRRIMRGK